MRVMILIYAAPLMARQHGLRSRHPANSLRDRIKAEVINKCLPNNRDPLRVALQLE